ncbi:MAG: response regulator [Planctomycetota bacterium]
MAKILCVRNDESDVAELAFVKDSDLEVTYVSNCGKALEMLRENEFDGLYCCGQNSPRDSLTELFRSKEILDLIPEALALLDADNQIALHNARLTNWFQKPNMVGLNFYDAIGPIDIVGDEPSPLATARSTRQPCTATLMVGDRYYQLSVIPVIKADTKARCEQMLVSLSDCTENIMLRQKMEALHQAGTVLADLRPEEIYEMDKEQRIELLVDNILHFTKDLLKFDVVEIRLKDLETGILKVLLSAGINSKESKGTLRAKSFGNGVTGFVAATGQSYLCEDTTDDSLYLNGLMGAKSSLTVPLIFHEKVIGTFNVESPEIGAFTENDLLFVQSFARDIAVALNTLELLNAQRTDAAIESVTEIQRAVAKPIDAILNDTVHAIESYIGHDPDVTKRLRSILQNAREIKRSIQKVGEEMAPGDQVPATVQVGQRSTLKDKRVLVIDADEQVRDSAHLLLERYGCDVETAHEGREAMLMVQNCDHENDYDAIIADIRLPDIGGYDLLMKLKAINVEPPLILMTGFGYDPGHSIVKARQAGLKANALLFKPFRLDQLLEVVESVVAPETASPST